MLHNPKDPLLNAPPPDKALWDQIGKICGGFPVETVLTIGFNLVINGLRQTQPSQKAALDIFDQITTQARARLAEHYGTNGVRRSIFPFDQRIEVDFTDFRKDRN